MDLHHKMCRCREMISKIAIIIMLSHGIYAGSAGTHSQQILYISHDTLHLYNVLWKNSSKISKHLQHLIEVDYHFETQTIFYIIDSNNINSTSLITQDVQMVLSTDTNDIHHMAVDWITKKIYFTGQSTMRIEVCNFDGSHRRVLFRKLIGDPLGIAVSPKHGLMFYTDVGDSPTIERVNMDGTDNRELVNTDVQYPSIITVDPDNELVYWYDYWKKTLEMMKLDGSSRQTLVFQETRYNHPFSSMTVLGSKIYFAYGNKLSSCSKNNASLTSCQTELSQLTGVLAIHAYGKKHQKYGYSACHKDNGGCSHLCLLKPNGYSCTCPTGFKLKSDGRTCASEMEKFILYCTKRHLRIISLDADSHIDLTLPMSNLRTVYSVDYDPVDKMIYWTDIANLNYGTIKRAYLDGTGVETVVPEGFTLSDHLAIDWIARNLYWTCPAFNKIYVSRLDGSEIIVIVDTDLEEPRGVAVDPGDGRLYWSDWGETNPKIESADLDGTNRVILVNESLQWPNGVAIDYFRRRLYWVDAGTDKIEYYDLVHKTRHLLSPGSPHAFGVSILGDMIYWTDWQDRSLHKLDLINGERGFVVQEIPDIMGMKAIDTTLRYGNNDCQNNSHGCSHFCFHKPRVGAVCACPDGFALDDNKKGCIALSGYLFYATQSYINALSLDRPKTISTVPKITDNAITHVDTHVKSNQVFWANNSVDGLSASAIKSSFINDTSHVKVIHTGFYGPMGGIAIDWISGNVYWSQQHLKRIEVSRLDGRFRTTIVSSRHAIRIRSVAINPRLRKLYWFEVYERLDSRLYVSNLDGTNQGIIVNITGEPNGLVIDYNDSRIYWVAKNTIESIDSNGKNRKLIAGSLGTPVELAIFKDRLYFCEQERQHEVVPSISSLLKYDGSKKEILKSESEGIWFQDITVHHTSLQIGENICDRRNGGCQHLCFATSVAEHVCSCEMHYQLNLTDNSTCVGPSIFVLLSEETVVYRVLLNKKPEVPLNFNALISVASIEYNLKTETIYWLDAVSGHIKYLTSARHTDAEIVDLKVENAEPASFVIDFFSNLLYWINKNTNGIMFINLDDPEKNGVIFQNDKFHPRKLAILPEKGLLFFVNEYLTDTTHDYDSIESITLAGTNLKTLQKFFVSHRKLDHGQYDITVDYVGERVYYLHRPNKRIDSVGISGGEVQIQMQFRKNLFTPVAIAVYGDNLYWLDINIESGYEKLKWCSIHNYERKKISNFPRIFENTKDLLIVNLERRNAHHLCKRNNGGCSHICYAVENKIRCACPRGMAFKHGNKRSCYVCAKYDQQCRLDTCKRLTALCRRSDRIDCNELFSKKNADCIDLLRMNQTTTSTPLVTVRASHHQSDYDYSKSIAGIVSGCVLTTLVLGCVMFVICRLQHKKQSVLKKQEQQVFLQKEECKFEAGTESVYILPESFHYKSLETVTDSIAPTNCSTELTNFRYITGSSNSYIPGSPSKLNDSVMLPLNPPPSAISSNSMQDISVCASNAYSSDMFETVDIPAPPSTPLYTPSETESVTDGQSSILSNTCLSHDKQPRPHSCTSHEPMSLRSQHFCDHRYMQQNYIYCKKQNSNERYVRCRAQVPHNRPTPSLASSYVSSIWRPINSHNSCGSSIDSRRRQSLTRQLSHITSIADSIVDSNGGQLPSLASGEYTSSSSVSSRKTIQHISENYEADSNVFNSYAPPPLPREIAPFNLQDLDDDQAYEVAFLLEESPEETVVSNAIENF